MGVKVQRQDTEDFQVTLVEPSFEEEPSIYDLQYLVYRLDLQRQFSLSDLETKIISFILSYKSVSNKFYFGNESLGKLFDKSERSVSRTIGALEKKGLITTFHKVMAGGGEIRFISVDKNFSQGWTKMSSEDGQKCLENNNKINNNKYNNIYVHSFNKFWDKYPKKVSKKKSLDIYTKIVTSEEIEQSLLKGLDSYKEKWRIEGTDVKYIPNPSTWLNQARWEDEVVVSNSVYKKNAQEFEEQWKQVKSAEKRVYQEVLIDNGSGGPIKLSELFK